MHIFGGAEEEREGEVAAAPSSMMSFSFGFRESAQAHSDRLPEWARAEGRRRARFLHPTTVDVCAADKEGEHVRTMAARQSWLSEVLNHKSGYLRGLPVMTVARSCREGEGVSGNDNLRK